MPGSPRLAIVPRPGAAEARPGAALRAIRNKKGWTLAEVSQRTGLPVSTLSKVENDRMSLTYDKLARISTGLDIDISALFGSGANGATAVGLSGRRCITRAGEGKAIETETYDHVYPAADLLNKRFVPIIADIKARSIQEFGELIRHPGEEWAYVLEGAIELHTELYAPLLLKVGDSIYFDSGMGHAYIAGAPGRCRVLAICSGSESQLIAATTGEPTEQSHDGHKPPPPSKPRRREKS
jgi:transcriptional regulator with XRE-family HTH domain